VFLFMNGRILCLAGLLLGWSGSLRADEEPKAGYGVWPSSATVKRRQAAQAIAQDTDPAQAGAKFLEMAKDKDAMTRALAAESIGNLKFAPARGKLEELLLGDPNEQVREAAAVSLRQIADPAAVEALGKALNDVSPNVRVTALSGIAFYRDTNARPLVEAACKDKAAEVRRTAVYVLGRLDDPQAVPVVKGLLNDVDLGVRAGAAQTLGTLHAVDSKEALTALLKDPEKPVQASAALSLAILGDSSGTEAAKGLVQDPDIAVRLLAIDALGWSKDPSAGRLLESLLTTSPADTRAAVRGALARHQQMRKQP